MKAILVAAGLALVLAGATALHAQEKVYTWTDARGRIHITDEPPPSEASIKDIVEAPQLTSAETRERELDRQRRMERREADQQRSEVQEALRRAREADEQAQEAIRRADEQTQQAIDYRKRFGNTPSRRQQFKYKILAEEEKAEAARADAQKAIDRARAASEKARTVAGPQTQEPTKP
jgi:hypothetical protein